MASKLGKFERTFVVCEFVVTTTKFLQKLVVNRTTAANFFPPNFVALLCHVTGMRTKVQMIDFVVVVVVVVGSKGLYYNKGVPPKRYAFDFSDKNWELNPPHLG